MSSSYQAAVADTTYTMEKALKHLNHDQNPKVLEQVYDWCQEIVDNSRFLWPEPRLIKIRLTSHKDLQTWTAQVVGCSETNTSSRFYFALPDSSLPDGITVLAEQSAACRNDVNGQSELSSGLVRVIKEKVPHAPAVWALYRQIKEMVVKEIAACDKEDNWPGKGPDGGNTLQEDINASATANYNPEQLQLQGMSTRNPTFPNLACKEQADNQAEEGRRAAQAVATSQAHEASLAIAKYRECMEELLHLPGQLSDARNQSVAQLEEKQKTIQRYRVQVCKPYGSEHDARARIFEMNRADSTVRKLTNDLKQMKLEKEQLAQAKDELEKEHQGIIAALHRDCDRDCQTHDEELEDLRNAVSMNNTASEKIFIDHRKAIAAMRKAHELESLGFTAAPEERLDATFEELQQSKKESRLSKLEDNYLTELTVAYDKVKELIAKLDKSTGAVGHAEAKPEKSIEQSQAAKQDAAELRARNNELEQAHGELQSRYDQLQKENIELQTRCGRLHVGNELLKDRFDGLQAQYQRGIKCGIELEEMWKELKQNNDALRSRYEQLEKNATELQEDYSRLRIDNGELQNLYSTLSIQFTAGVKCGAELQGRWAKVQAEKNHLQERYDELEQAKVKLENRHIKLKTFNAELRKSNDELKQRCGQLDRRWEECCLQVNKTKQQISKCEDRSRTLSLALADMTRREREAKQAQVTTESRMRDQLAALEQAGALEVSDLKKEIARLNCVLTEKQDHTERLEQIAYSTHFELSETEKAVAEAKHAEQQAMNALTAEEEKVCSLQARYNELQKQAEASHELIHNFFEPHVGAITAANCDMSEKLHIVERAWAEASLTVEEYENEIALLHKQIAAGLSRENLWKQKVDVLAPKNEAPIANVLEFMKAHKNTEVSADSSVIAQTTLEEMEEEIIESAEQITEGAEDLDGLRFLDEDEEEDEEEEEEYEAEEEAEEGEYEEKEEEEESQFELVEVP